LGEASGHSATIAANPSVVELLLLTGFGIIGFLMRKFDYPVAPAVVGLILGPLADSALRRSLQMSLGDPMILLQHWSSAIMIAIAVIALIAPFAFRGLSKFQQDED
jgi:putative tricarboxylic transport membrane protein